MPGRLALWRALIERGLAESERDARGLIMSGRVLVDDQPVDKAGASVHAPAAIRIRGQRHYASRGGEKLEHALGCFGISPLGRVALDAGASTGGFTDCLLHHGAMRVFAVEVGFGQLLGRLRQDPRVVNLERTNLGDLKLEWLQPPPTLATLDLSYLPLAKAWRIIQPFMARHSDIVNLVKPLFEVNDATARRTGVIGGAAPYLEILERLVDDCLAMGWSPVAISPSPIRGSSGTVEFLAHVKNVLHVGPRPDVEQAVTAAFTTQVGAAIAPQQRPPS